MKKQNIWEKLKSNKKNIIALAPMDGVTDFIFREIIAEIGKPDLLFTEFTNVTALVKVFERMEHRLKFSQKQKPIIAQIWGTEPEHFKNVAKILSELNFDGIDINMGCPAKSAIKLGSGAGHIKNPKLAAEIIQATKEGAGETPVSVKTRIGIRKVVTEEWAEFLLKQDIAALTIHGRTASQMSNVPCDWSEIQKVVDVRDALEVKTPILGNGDIKSIEEAHEAQKKYKVDGVMIGRGIFQNAWLFASKNSGHTPEDKLDLFKKHLEMHREFYKGKYFDVMKKYAKIYIRDFENSTEIKTKIMETKNFEEAMAVLSLIHARD